MKTIALTQGKVALVDDEDYESLSVHKWYAMKSSSGNFYAVRKVTTGLGRLRQRMVLMHAVINNTPDEFDTDHVDNNGLNNQRHNLRTATHKQNTTNLSRKRAGCSSQYRGVSLRASGKWAAHIRVNNKTKSLGLFKSEVDAASAYDAEGIKQYGEFFTPNFSASWLAPSIP